MGRGLGDKWLQGIKARVEPHAHQKALLLAGHYGDGTVGGGQKDASSSVRISRVAQARNPPYGRERKSFQSTAVVPLSKVPNPTQVLGTSVEDRLFTQTPLAQRLHLLVSRVSLERHVLCVT